ncbi:MAG: hypothetical protein ABI399_03940 [Bauldia sp.]
MAVKPKPKARVVPARRAPAAPPVEHRIAVASVGITVAYSPARAEQFELRGAGTLNASLPDGGTRTTGQATVILGRGARSGNSVAYDPASLNRNLIFTLFFDAADFALFHDVFVRNPGGYDPGLRLWAKTAGPLDTADADTQPAIDFGYRLDLVHTPAGQR